MNSLDLFEQNAGLILASEDWANVYKSHPESFAMLVKAEAKIERTIVEYLKGLSERSFGFVDWSEYSRKLAEITGADQFNVDVIVREIPDSEDGLIMQIMYQPIALAVEAGLISAEDYYKIILPESSIPEYISKVARENIAFLVGKRVDRDGNIVPAKNPKYHINDVTRDQIKDSIRTSLSIGETQTQAAERLAQRIKDPKRASKIASTESVNAFQGGQYEYAKTAGATKKKWQVLPGACPRCLANANAGEIDIDGTFPSGHKLPTCHSWDRCGLVYTFPEQLNN